MSDVRKRLPIDQPTIQRDSRYTTLDRRSHTAAESNDKGCIGFWRSLAQEANLTPFLLAPDRLRCDFQADRPNQRWVGAVTFISTREGWLYLAVLIDLYSRKVVGWALSDRNDERLV